MRSRLLVCRVLGLALVASACGPDLEPCPGVVEGATYDAQIGALIDDNDAECATTWGLQQGATFKARVVSLQGQSECLTGNPELMELQGWSFGQPGPTASTGTFMEGFYEDAHFGDCLADVRFRVAAEGDATCFTDGGTSSTCLLRFTLDPRGTGPCREVCDVAFSSTFARR